MADASERIVILSFIILLFIASQSSIRENTRLEIDTDKPEYTVGERVKLTFYIVNPNPVPVKIEPYNIFEIDVFLNNIPQDGAFTAHNQWESGAMITIPPESRHKIDDMTFVANEAGNLTINLNIRIKNDLAGSARHTVLILDSEFEGDPIQAKMNKHSFHNAENASLIITNNSPDTITLGDKYEMQKKEGVSWMDVPHSLHHPAIWDMIAYIVDSGASFSQQVSIEMLETGQYRIIKEVHSDVPREHIATLIVEFEIQGLVDETYNLSGEEAVDIAVEAAEPKEWVDIDAKMLYLDELLDDTPIEKHVWVVSLYNTPRKANSGTFLRVIIDPHNGTVYESELIAWMSTP